MNYRLDEIRKVAALRGGRAKIDARAHDAKTSGLRDIQRGADGRILSGIDATGQRVQVRQGDPFEALRPRARQEGLVAKMRAARPEVPEEVIRQVIREVMQEFSITGPGVSGAGFQWVVA